MSKPLLSVVVTTCVVAAFGIGGGMGLAPVSIGIAGILSCGAGYLVYASGDSGSSVAGLAQPATQAASGDPVAASTSAFSSSPATSENENEEDLSALQPEELAKRYYTNFLVPIRQSLPGTRASDLGATPERIQVLIPDTPSSRNALRNTVRASCRSVAITPDQYARQFGIYFYSPGKARSGTIVDVPTILHGKAAESRGDISPGEFYGRFAQGLASLVQQEEEEGLDITIHRDVRSFPLNR